MFKLSYAHSQTHMKACVCSFVVFLILLGEDVGYKQGALPIIHPASLLLTYVNT